MTIWSAYLRSDAPTSRRQALLCQLWRRWLALRRNPLAVVGLLIVVTLLAIAMFAPLIATHDPIAQNLDQRLRPPSAAAWLGTDALGRDIFSRIIHGARVTLIIVLLVVVTVGPIGLFIGASAGYLGGWVDRALMRFTMSSWRFRAWCSRSRSSQRSDPGSSTRSSPSP